MTKLPSSDKVISVLIDYGFVFKSQKGNHQKYIKREKTVIVPSPRKQIPLGTLKSISKQSGIFIGLAISDWNSKVVDLIKELMSYSINVLVVDPWASTNEVAHEYGISMMDRLVESMMLL